MPNISPERAGQITAILARQYPRAYLGWLARAVVAGLEAAKLAQSYAEQECNFPLTDKQMARMNVTLARKQSAANDVLMQALADDPCEGGFPVFHIGGGDPRGPCGYLEIPGLRGDGWDADKGFPLA